MQGLINCSLWQWLWLWLLGSCQISLINTALLYPTNSEYGIFMAISVPISLPHRNVFVSYNYEFNYYQPEHVYKFPPILMGQDFAEDYLTYPTHDASTGRECLNCTASVNSTAKIRTENLAKIKERKKSQATPNREKRELSMMTRKSFYAMLRDKLERSAYPAEACLLRLICETNASTLGEVNGLLGNIVHVIFTPSSSRDEQLPSIYYQAEADGLQQQCATYSTDCSHNVLDLISAPVEQILKDIASKRRRKK
ncbi:uncharacterized protein LOC116804953 [Drosophila grimshawi]|uniref:uncharacterized protein LOC116804953 n=1 Tax=Drosophila grimshawi TaxID=7222 RepID=UPI000C86F8FE|nr:uncharacterized protein LOC116804953 [Drosophila grimshawi]